MEGKEDNCFLCLCLKKMVLSGCCDGDVNKQENHGRSFLLPNMTSASIPVNAGTLGAGLCVCVCVFINRSVRLQHVLI